MPAKTTHIDSVGNVNIVRRRGLRAMRLNVDNKGAVRLTLPWWVSIRSGIDFVNSKANWIHSQKEIVKFTPVNDMEFGKGLRLQIKQSKSSRFRRQLEQHTLIVSIPSGNSVEDESSAEFMKKSILWALRIQAEDLILPRIRELANIHGFNYKSCTIKQLKSRWGSCSQAGDIVINLYLIQLPWELIDYVILHELNHTKHLYHGPVFWEGLEVVSPKAKSLRKILHDYQPRLYNEVKPLVS